MSIIAIERFRDYRVNIYELRANQRVDYLTTGTFQETFPSMNPTSLCIEKIVLQLLRLYVVDFFKISWVKLSL